MNSSQSSQQSDDHFSVTLALNRLKQTENRIYQAKHRLDWINTRYSRLDNKEMRKSHVSNFKDEIRNFAENNKAIKEQQHHRRSKETDRYHEINMEKRKNHQDCLRQLRETMHSKNKWVRDQIRKQKVENQKSIKKQKFKELSEKRKSREEKYQSEQMRLKYMKEYMKNKELTTKLRKAEQMDEIKRKITQREQFLHKLERQGSDYSGNPEQQSNKVDESKKDMEESRGFRVKVYKNHTSVLIE